MAKGFIALPILGGIPDPTNPPELKFTTNNRPYWALANGTDELLVYQFVIPENYASTPILRYYLSPDTASTNVVRMGSEWQLTASGENVETDSWTEGISSDSDTTVSSATNLFIIEHSLTNITVAVDDLAHVRVRRENTTTPGTNMSGDLLLWGLIFEYTTT